MEPVRGETSADSRRTHGALALIRTLPELKGQFNQTENSPMIVTSRLSIDIVRYLDRRTQGVPLRWTLLSEIADHVYGPEDLALNQAVDLARCRGWIIVEGKPPSRRASLTKAGCSLVLSSLVGGQP
jgi:hypothetical protein